MKRICYNINNPVNAGTEESPEWVDRLVPKSIPYSEVNKEIAKAEAHNGEYTIEDDGQPEPEMPETGDFAFDEMAMAIKEGVNDV